jgi:hypothetical protein
METIFDHNPTLEELRALGLHRTIWRQQKKGMTPEEEYRLIKEVFTQGRAQMPEHNAQQSHYIWLTSLFDIRGDKARALKYLDLIEDERTRFTLGYHDLMPGPEH